MLTNFWKKRYEFSEVRKPKRVIDSFLDIVDEFENLENYNVTNLEIKEENFNKYY